MPYKPAIFKKSARFKCKNMQKLMMMLSNREFKCIQRLRPHYESSHNLPVSTRRVNIDLNLALLPGI